MLKIQSDNKKKKRRLLKSLTIIIFITIFTIPFIDWYKKNKIQDSFNDIKFSIYQAIPNREGESFEKVLSYCDTVNQFLINNPIENDIELNCNDYSNQTDSSVSKSYRNDFIQKVQDIDSKYRKRERAANYRFFITLIICQILNALIKSYIDKKFKDDNKTTHNNV